MRKKSTEGSVKTTEPDIMISTGVVRYPTMERERERAVAVRYGRPTGKEPRTASRVEAVDKPSRDRLGLEETHEHTRFMKVGVEVRGPDVQVSAALHSRYEHPINREDC